MHRLPRLDWKQSMKQRESDSECTKMLGAFPMRLGRDGKRWIPKRLPLLLRCKDPLMLECHLFEAIYITNHRDLHPIGWHRCADNSNLVNLPCPEPSVGIS